MNITYTLWSYKTLLDRWRCTLIWLVKRLPSSSGRIAGYGQVQYRLCSAYLRLVLAQLYTIYSPEISQVDRVLFLFLFFIFYFLFFILFYYFILLFYSYHFQTELK